MIPFEVLTLTGGKLEEMFVEKGFAREGVYILGYCNSVQGYLLVILSYSFPAMLPFEKNFMRRVPNTSDRVVFVSACIGRD